MTCGSGPQVLDNARCFDSGERVGADQDIAEGLRLSVIAVVSAAAMATLVIGAGQAFLPDLKDQANPPVLTRVSLP